MELIDIYNMYKENQHKAVPRGSSLSKDEHFIVVHVCIINSKNEMLIQKRSRTKYSWPNYWDFSAAGAVSSGEKPDVSAYREVNEELGIEIDIVGKRESFTINFENGFDNFYIVKSDININQLKLQIDEVDDIKWATEEEIINMIQKNNFIQYHESLIQMIFHLSKSNKEKGIYK